MDISVKNTPNKDDSPLWPLTIAILITFLLFFIDEGYYDLRWMKSGVNWFWFAVYATGFLFIQAIVHQCLWWYRGKNKIAITCVTGLVIGLVLVVMAMG
jgi:hypothetical protein